MNISLDFLETYMLESSTGFGADGFTVTDADYAAALEAYRLEVQPGQHGNGHGVNGLGDWK